MRIRAVTLKNYRRHGQLAVSLDPHRTLITGPNEIGKSSLIEAIHRCLFYRHRSKAAGLLERMQPRTGGDPEVTLDFSIGDTDYTLFKKFRGATGSRAVLTDAADQRWEGDAAEETLQRLLNVEEVRGQQSEAFNSQWAHLWVWQGSARDEPSGTTCSSTAQQLRNQLQQQGGLGVIASQWDEAVKAVFVSQAEAIFGRAGKPKQHSRLGQAESRQAAAEEKLQAAEQQWQAGQDATARLALADTTVAEQTERKAEAEAVLVPLRQRKANADRLAEQLAEQQQAAEQAAATLEQLTTTNTEISQLATEAAAVKRQITPATEQLEEFHQQSRLRADDTRQAAGALEAARRSLAETQEYRDLYAAQRIAIQAAREAGDLAQLSERIRAAGQQHDTLVRQLDEIPAIDAEAVEALRGLEQRLEQARLTVELLAARIELSDGGHEVRLNHAPLTAGKPRIITEQASLTIDGSTRLLITPGGGTSLAAARQTHEETAEQFRSQLNELGVADIKAAAERLARRQQLKQQIEQHDRDRANLLDGQSEEDLLDCEQASRQRLAEARQKVAALQQRAEDRLSTVELPKELTELEAAVQPIDAAYGQLQQQVQKLSADHQTAVELQEVADATLHDHQQTVEADRKKLDALTLKQSLLEQQHGDAETRATTLTTAQQAHQIAGESLAAISQQLEQADLPGIEADMDRFQRSIDEAERLMQTARETRAAAQATLQHYGGLDLHQARAAAQAEYEAATREYDTAKKQADAITRLRDCFVELNSERADQLAAPLRAKAEDYLAAMFGKGTRVSLTLAGDGEGFSDLTVTRPGVASDSFAFSELSGGTQEQVAAAIRLAMAEILAGGSGGCLPIVFDDAFTNCDPERIGLLQRMLDLAAKRGIQVIVLSCNPTDYHMFGATEIDLRRHTEQPPLPSAGSTSAIPPIVAVADDDATALAATEPAAELVATVDPADAAADDEQFLTVVSQSGGTAGNKSLRELLGWNEQRYEAAKERLVAGGRLEKGRGKGGSVRLPGAG